MFKEELINLIKVEMKDDLVSQVMDAFDSEIVPLEDANDPSRPSIYREEFKTFLEETVDSSLEITDEYIKFGIGDEKKLGFNEELDDDTTDGIKIIGTILQGISGEYVLITPDLLKIMFPKERSSDLGRTGGAYLMRVEEYNQGMDLRGWPSVPIWGFSNFPGLPSFFDSIDIEESIVKAISKLKGIKST